MAVNKDLIMEILRPGTGDPAIAGDVGEIVVTSLDPDHRCECGQEFYLL